MRRSHVGKWLRVLRLAMAVAPVAKRYNATVEYLIGLPACQEDVRSQPRAIDAGSSRSSVYASTSCGENLGIKGKVNERQPRGPLQLWLDT